METEVTFEGLSCPVPLPDATLDRIALGHGSGGRLSHDLIRQVFLPDLGNPPLSALNDGAVLTLPNGDGRLVVSTDAHVVQPLFFPGGDIGRLAVCGTVNDLAMMGARPLWLTAAFVLEEGLSIETLRRVVRLDAGRRGRGRHPGGRGRHQGGGARGRRWDVHHHGWSGVGPRRRGHLWRQCAPRRRGAGLRHPG